MKIVIAEKQSVASEANDKGGMPSFKSAKG